MDEVYKVFEVFIVWSSALGCVKSDDFAADFYQLEDFLLCWCDVDFAIGISNFNEADDGSCDGQFDCSDVFYTLEAEDLDTLLNTGLGGGEEDLRVF